MIGRRAAMIVVALFAATGGVVMLSCGGSSPGAHPTGHKTTPLNHIATPPVCGAWDLSDYCPVSGGGGSCTSAADCTAGLDGRCRLTFTSTNPSGACACQYEPCHTDSDCPADSDCVCNPIAGGAGSSGNLPTACLASNCHSDADCPSGFCSPSMVPARCGPTTLGNYCHTAADECNNDSDCTADAAGNVASCVYSKELGRWACTASPAVGCGG